MRPFSRISLLSVILATALLTAMIGLTTDRNERVGAVYASPVSTVLTLGGERIFTASPAAADLNSGGSQEIVVGAYDGMLYVLSYVGSSWTTVWQRQTAFDLNTVLPVTEQQSIGRIEATPAIGDIDDDGDLEIVVATGGLPSPVPPIDNRNGGIIAYELVSDSGSNWAFAVKAGWPFVMPDTMGSGTSARLPDGVRDGILGTPTLGDIDGDNDLEIISMAFDRRIRAFHHDGSEVAGWPIQRESGDIILRGGQSSAAIGDIDNDGLNEVIIGNNGPPWNGDDGSGPFPDEYDIPDYTLATVWALNGDSTLVPGWPVITEQVVQSSPALGDIDGDGELEIVVGTGNFPGYVNGYQMYAWNGDGSPVAGWPVSTAHFMSSSPALADLDGNGILDVVIGCGDISQLTCKTVYAWDGSGNDLPGFPMAVPFVASYPPAVADLDGNGDLEILLNSLQSTSVSVIQHDGANSGVPVDASRVTSSFIINAPLVEDVDGDGSLETVIGGATSGGQAAVYIFEESASSNDSWSSLPWSMFQRAPAHTSLFLPPELSFPAELRFYHQQGTGSTEDLRASIANIGGMPFDWNVDVTGTSGNVSVNSNTGTLDAGMWAPLTFTANTLSCPPFQWCNLGNVSVSATLNGANARSSPRAVAVWLYVGDVSRIHLPAIRR